MTPVIDSDLQLNQLADALRYLEQGHARQSRHQFGMTLTHGENEMTISTIDNSQRTAAKVRRLERSCSLSRSWSWALRAA